VRWHWQRVGRERVDLSNAPPAGRTWPVRSSGSRIHGTVIGGTGFRGQALVRRLRQDGHGIGSAPRNPSGFPELHSLRSRGPQGVSLESSGVEAAR